MLGKLAEKRMSTGMYGVSFPGSQDAMLLKPHLWDMRHEPLNELTELRLTRDPVTWVSLLRAIRKRNRALWHRGQGLYVLG